MSDATATLLDRLDAQWQALLEQVQPLGETALRTQPRSEAWSILDILEHVVVSEAVILKGLPPWDTLTAQRRTLAHRAKLLLVRLVLALGIPVKVPSRRMLPSGQLGLDQITEQRRGHQEWLRAFLAEAGEGADHRACFSHPVAGPISLREALRLDLMHMQTHGKQIRARLRELQTAKVGPSETSP